MAKAFCVKSRLCLCALAALVCVGILAITAGSASAEKGSGYFVTFVARSCPAYTDIFANRSRNDILESLKNLGPDSQYDDSGRLINPVDESRPPQNVCRPIVGWQFTLGRGYQSRAVTGPWGSLSKVTSPFKRAPIVTKPIVFERNENGQPIGLITGATTIELTKAERAQASTRDQLWTQGGTPTDPVLANKFPGPKYGFGALRCATDNLNGDNVEYIYFPAGVKHVYCYGLYVKPAPTAGLITIKKEVTGTPSGDNPSFPFTGSISYDPNGFQLSNGQSADFYRAGGQTWNLVEGDVANYEVTAVDCAAVAPGGKPGKSTTTITGSATAIHLVAGEHVTCVYHNRYVPPVGGLEIRKITKGGVGTFSYKITSSTSPEDVHRAQAITTEPNVPVDATPSFPALTPGSYTITERLPKAQDGRWVLLRVNCNGVTQPAGRSVKVEIQRGTTVVCTFLNGFIPRGSISLSKVTQGGIGITSFLVSPRSGEPAQYLQHATTTTPGVAVDAVPATPADATTHLRLGSYSIVEQLPASGPPNGWDLSAVVCNGVTEPFEQGTVVVNLTLRQPHVNCGFTDTFTFTPPPDPPVPPVPPVPPKPPVPPYVATDLVVTKHATPTVVARGGLVSYRITVTNRGPSPAERVVLDDQPLGRAIIVGAHTSTGDCAVQPRIACQLGTLKVGATAVITLELRPNVRPSKFTNRAVAGTATPELTPANNVATATITVTAPPPPPPGRG